MPATVVVPSSVAPGTLLLISLAMGLLACSGEPQGETATKRENVASVQLRLTTVQNVWHWNVAGSALHDGYTGTGLIEVMANSIRTSNAYVVTVNEICRGQYSRLIDNLNGGSYAGGGTTPDWTTGPYSGSFSRFTTKRVASPGYCHCISDCGPEFDYGQALFYKYGLGTSSTLLLQDDPITGEDYKLLCAPSAEIPHLRLCVTHLSHHLKYAGLQEDQVRTKLEEYYRAGDTVVVGGDFNIEPHQDHLNDWYTSAVNTTNNSGNFGAYHELDDNSVCPGYGEITFEGGGPANPPNPCGSYKKIDHFFVRANKLSGSNYSLDARAIPNSCDTNDGGYSGTKNEPCSDHHKIDGYASLYVNR